MVPIAQKLAADAENHGPVPIYQSGKSRLPRGIAAGREPLKELPVAQPGDGATVEE